MGIIDDAVKITSWEDYDRVVEDLSNNEALLPKEMDRVREQFPQLTDGQVKSATVVLEMVIERAKLSVKEWLANNKR